MINIPTVEGLTTNLSNLNEHAQENNIIICFILFIHVTDTDKPVPRTLQTAHSERNAENMAATGQVHTSIK